MRSVVCVRPDVGLASLTPIFDKEEVGLLPVVDHSGRLMGIVSRVDLRGGEHETVREVMKMGTTSLRETDDLGQAAATMVVEGAYDLPVVSSDGALVGILSALDLVGWNAPWERYLAARD